MHHERCSSASTAQPRPDLRRPELSRLGLISLVVSALAALGAMLTGEPAEEAVEHLAGVTERAIHVHEEAAELAAVATYVGGAIALAALMFFRRRGLGPPLATLALVVALAAFGLMARTANLGGQIRHPEISGVTAAEEHAGAGEPTYGEHD